MPTGDGLIVRLKPRGGIELRLAERIAQWSHQWGNGQIELTSRGSLQLRGLTERHLPDLYDALAEEDLLDPDAAREAVRNVIRSPLAGLDPAAMMDIRGIANALERRLADDPALHALPGKFGFSIDDGGRFGLADVAADISFVARPGRDDPHFAIVLDGGPLDAARCQPDALVEAAAVLSRVFLAGRQSREISQRQEIGRMRDLVKVRGARSMLREAGLALDIGCGSDPHTAKPGEYLGPHSLGAAAFLGVGLPFGAISAGDLRTLVAAASDAGAAELRLTPWRAMLIPLPSTAAALKLCGRLTADAFILDPAEPRRRVAACSGAPSCSRGTTAVREHAASLAAELAGLPGTGILLHVSGCEKGCAYPRRAPVTLVARYGRYHVARDSLASGAIEDAAVSLNRAADIVRRTAAGLTDVAS